MRCLLKVSLPVDNGNEAAINGTLGSTIESILSDLKPEAAFFTAQQGQRGGVIIFDLKDSSQIPAVAEPWFLAFNAQVEIVPCMNVDDLKKAVPGIERSVKQYRSLKRAA
jgi:uncharacterized protein DUF3303